MQTDLTNLTMQPQSSVRAPAESVCDFLVRRAVEQLVERQAGAQGVDPRGTTDSAPVAPPDQQHLTGHANSTAPTSTAPNHGQAAELRHQSGQTLSGEVNNADAESGEQHAPNMAGQTNARDAKSEEEAKATSERKFHEQAPKEAAEKKAGILKEAEEEAALKAAEEDKAAALKSAAAVEHHQSQPPSTPQDPLQSLDDLKKSLEVIQARKNRPTSSRDSSGRTNNTAPTSTNRLPDTSTSQAAGSEPLEELQRNLDAIQARKRRVDEQRLYKEALERGVYRAPAEAKRALVNIAQDADDLDTLERGIMEIVGPSSSTRTSGSQGTAPRDTSPRSADRRWSPRSP